MLSSVLFGAGRLHVIDSHKVRLLIWTVVLVGQRASRTVDHMLERWLCMYLGHQPHGLRGHLQGLGRVGCRHRQMLDVCLDQLQQLVAAGAEHPVFLWRQPFCMQHGVLVPMTMLTTTIIICNQLAIAIGQSGVVKYLGFEREWQRTPRKVILNTKLS
jgi:hypothetical protein